MRDFEGGILIKSVYTNSYRRSTGLFLSFMVRSKKLAEF
jgi:hypothetical protein